MCPDSVVPDPLFCERWIGSAVLFALENLPPSIRLHLGLKSPFKVYGAAFSSLLFLCSRWVRWEEKATNRLIVFVAPGAAAAQHLISCFPEVTSLKSNGLFSENSKKNLKCSVHLGSLEFQLDSKRVINAPTGYQKLSTRRYRCHKKGTLTAETLADDALCIHIFFEFKPLHLEASAVFSLSACSFTPLKVPSASCTAVRPRLFELTSSDRLSPYIKHHNRAIL